MKLATKNVLAAVIWVALVALCGVLLASQLPSCGPAVTQGDEAYQQMLNGIGCEPTELQCNQSILAICNADHQWSAVVDCAEFSEPKTCCENNGKMGCFSIGECNETSN